jgi:carboxypeptidase A2
MKSLVLLILGLAAVSAFRYDGYRMIQVGPLHDKENAKLVVALADDDERVRQVILMTEHVSPSEVIELAIAPQSFNRISEFLDTKGFPFVITINDLQKSFDDARIENEMETIKWQKSGSKAAPTSYLRHTDQNNWLTSTAAASSIASTFSVGNSYGGRTMLGISINAGRNDLPGIWIDSNIHAREWISSATTLYIIDQILNGASADAVRMRTNYRWYILPNANPDGYEYTWTNDRLWRKTRSPNAGSACTGTDPNRNWDANWGGPGASDAPCSDTYMGATAFSEVENRNVRDFVNSIKHFTNVFVSIHCYSNYWLVPWGGYSYKPADYDELMRVGNLAAAAIQSVNGLRFTVGTPPDILYVAAGGSFDWAKEKAGIAYAYSPELRPATAAQGGFDIPASNITPSGAETFAGIVATVTNAAHKV